MRVSKSVTIQGSAPIPPPSPPPSPGYTGPILALALIATGGISLAIYMVARRRR